MLDVNVAVKTAQKNDLVGSATQTAKDAFAALKSPNPYQGFSKLLSDGSSLDEFFKDCGEAIGAARGANVGSQQMSNILAGVGRDWANRVGLPPAIGENLGRSLGGFLGHQYGQSAGGQRGRSIGDSIIT